MFVLYLEHQHNRGGEEQKNHSLQWVIGVGAPLHHRLRLIQTT